MNLLCSYVPMWCIRDYKLFECTSIATTLITIRFHRTGKCALWPIELLDRKRLCRVVWSDILSNKFLQWQVLPLNAADDTSRQLVSAIRAEMSVVLQFL